MYSQIKTILIVCIVLVTLTGNFQTTDAATEEEMRTAMQGLLDAVNVQDAAQMSSYWTDNIVYDFVAQPPALEGKDQVTAFFGGLFQGIPDFHSTQTRQLVSDNIMVTQATATGTHSGELSGIPATGNSLQLIPLHIWEFEGDKIKHVTEYIDMASMMMQMGLMPAPALDPALLVPSFELPDTEPTGLAPLEAAADMISRWNSGDLSRMAKIIHPDANILIAPLGIPLTRSAYIAVGEMMFQGFSKMPMEIVRSIDMGDGWVVTELLITGTNDGPYMGMPATRRSITLRGVSLQRYNADGLLTDLASYYDTLTMMAQMGLIPPPDPEPVNPGTDGLTAFYALDGDVNDGSGNELNGTIVGDPNFVEGKVGMALDLDGEDDLVELGKFDVVGHITLAAWIKPNDFGINDARIITKAKEWGGNDHWWMLSTISETSLRFRLKTDDGADTATLVSDPVLEAGVFAHVAATWDGGMMRIYKDGIEVASQKKGGTAVAVDPDISAAIGSQPSDAFASDPSHVAKFFDGLIDDVRIYNRALSDGEVMYLAGLRATPVDPGSDALVAFYALDGDPNDSSGNGNDGTVNGTENWVDGKIGSALEFDGSTTYVEIPFSESLKLLNYGDFTLSAWFLADEIPPENKEVLQQADANGPGRTWLFVHNTNEIRSFVGGGTTASGIGVEAGVWYHAAVVVTEGGDADNVQLYVNGEPAGEPTQRGMEDCEGVYIIGRHKNPTNYWDGLIDEIQLYNKALTDGEIRYLAGERAGDPSLVIYYSFDEVGDIVADQSGKGHDGVVIGDVTPVANGMYGGAANFATGSYLDLDGANFPVEDIPTSAMTLAAWINCANTGGDHEVFSARASDNTWLIHPEPKGSGDIRWLLRSYGGTTIFQIRAGTMTWDQWLHFAGTYDKESGKAALYINGELIEEMDVTSPADIAGDWDLGARVGLTIDDGRPFTGLMDEFRMYTRALSQDEILEIMQGM